MDILLRDIEPDIKMKLEKQARGKQLSLNKYLKKILEDYALNPEIRNVDDKYRLFTDKILSKYQNDIEKMNVALEENTYLLQKIEEMLKEREDY